MAATIRYNTELRRFTRNPLTIAAIIVVAAVPLLYGALYLWAFWNPTGHLDKLPVAIVVEDKPVKTSDGKTLDAGRQVADAVIEKKTVDWHRTTPARAETGLADGEYLAVVTIPPDFSAAVASNGTDHPKTAEFDVRYNDANGYTGRTVVSSVMRELRQAVSASLGEQVVDQLLVGFNEIHDQIAKAADGSAQLSDGAQSARDGSAELADGTAQLASGAHRLSAGAAKLDNGAGQLATGVHQAATGSAQLSSGATALADGATKANKGAHELSSGLDQLSSATKDLPAATRQLADGSRQVADGNAKVAAGVDTIADRVDAAAGVVEQTTAGASAARDQLITDLQAYLQQNPGDPAATRLLARLQDGTFDTAVTDLQTASSGLVNTADQARTDTARLAAGAEQVAAGNEKLAQSTPQLVAGINKADTGVNQLATGTSQLADGAARLKTGATELHSGLVRLDTGAQQLATGAHDLDTGAASLATGTDQAASGASQLHDGLVKLADGAAELQSGLDKGVQQIPTFNADSRAANAETISDPVRLNSSFLHEAAGNGEGFAPYFVGLALYVGAMILWMILRPVSQRSLAAPVSASRVAWMALQPAFVLGAVQSTVLLLVLIFALGLSPNHLLATAVFTLAVSAAFVALQQAIGIAFGSPGRILVLVLLMLQLTSAGGTYPSQLTPGFFQALHEVLPMTQVVNGLREAITGELDHRFWVALTYLVVMALVSFGLSCLAASRGRMWTMKRLHPAISL